MPVSDYLLFRPKVIALAKFDTLTTSQSYLVPVTLNKLGSLIIELSFSYRLAATSPPLKPLFELVF